MKFHAYVGPTGSIRKSAYQVRAERIKHYRGGPSPEKFFSLHREGRRKPLEHVIGPGRPFFRYSNANDEGGPGGPGESIEHLLYKEALASLTRTRLSLKGHGDHRIVITHGETEKQIPGASRDYRADVYLRFESEEPSELGLKWSGEVFIEIHKTNLVEPEKHDEVRDLGIPMVEVDLPKGLLYKHGGPETTDELERDYVEWLKNLLESEHGYVEAVVLSNTSSAAYLAKRLDEAQDALAQERQRHAATSSELASQKEANGKLRQALATAGQALDGFRAELSAATKEKAETSDQLKAQTGRLQDEREANHVLRQKLKDAHRRTLGAATATAALLVILALLRLKGPS